MSRDGPLLHTSKLAFGYTTARGADEWNVRVYIDADLSERKAMLRDMLLNDRNFPVIECHMINNYYYLIISDHDHPWSEHQSRLLQL